MTELRCPMDAVGRYVFEFTVCAPISSSNLTLVRRHCNDIWEALNEIVESVRSKAGSLAIRLAWQCVVNPWIIHD